MRVHVWFRLEVKHVGSLPHRLWAAGKQQRKDRFSDESSGLDVVLCVWVLVLPFGEVELVQPDRTVQGVSDIFKHLQAVLLRRLPSPQPL